MSSMSDDTEYVEMYKTDSKTQTQNFLKIQNPFCGAGQSNRHIQAGRSCGALRTVEPFFCSFFCSRRSSSSLFFVFVVRVTCHTLALTLCHTALEVHPTSVKTPLREVPHTRTDKQAPTGIYIPKWVVEKNGSRLLYEVRRTEG